MIAIRADGNSSIGSGHVMRCLSIAKAIKKAGGDCSFITADTAMQKVINENGFTVYSLSTDYQNMEEETESLLLVLRDIHADVILIDSYYATPEYVTEVSKHIKVALMDDYGKEKFPASLVINYNMYASEEEYRDLYGNSKTRFCLGPRFAPLRDEFTNLPEKKINEKVENVLILTGGADPEHVALRLVDEIAKSDVDIHFNIVAGALSEDIEKLRKVEASDARISVFVNVKNMHELMMNADIAVTAAGSTVYELCACKTPMIVYSCADNQTRNAKAIEQSLIGKYVGDIRNNSVSAAGIFADALLLAKNFSLRESLHFKTKDVSGKNGADLLGKEICGLKG